MKRKKCQQQASLLTEGSRSTTDHTEEKESYLIRSLNKKILILIALLS
jgi:hypothetical protein